MVSQRKNSVRCVGKSLLPLIQEVFIVAIENKKRDVLMRNTWNILEAKKEKNLGEHGISQIKEKSGQKKG